MNLWNFVWQHYHFAQRYVSLISLLALQSKVKSKEVRCEYVTTVGNQEYAGDELIQGALLTVPPKKWLQWQTLKKFWNWKLFWQSLLWNLSLRTFRGGTLKKTLFQLRIFLFRCRTRQLQWRSFRIFCIRRNSTRTCLLYQQTESFRSILLF